MTASLAVLTGLAALAVGAVIALKSGFARRVFFRLYALVKGDELVAPTVLHNPPLDSPYDRWLKRARQEIPVLEGSPMHAIDVIGLPPWPQLGEGVRGLYLHLANYQMLDGRVVEIAPRGQTVAQRHLYEIGIYIVSGSGHTSLQQEGMPERKIAWSAGDLFSIPLNVPHWHCAGSEQPTRMLQVTSFPLMMNLIDDEAFIENNPAVFTGRYDASSDYLDRQGELAELELTANFVRDIRSTPARRNDFRGTGNRSVRWRMTGNSILDMHISEMPPGTIKKAHRITSNGFVLILSGTGFSVLWREGAYRQRVRIDWKPGTLFVPPVFWYQQHLNSGPTPVRYLAINAPRFVRNIGLHFEDQLEVDLDEVKAEWRTELERAAHRQ